MAAAAKLTAHEVVQRASSEPSVDLAAEDYPPADVSRVAWQPRGELAFLQWVRQGRWLGAVGRGCAWWIGDWLRYGNASYGEKYAAAARITGYDVHSLMNMVYVASHVDPSRRREHLSFSHHAELAALAPEQQEAWLNRIEKDGLSVRALRGALRDPKPAMQQAADAPTPEKHTSPVGGESDAKTPKRQSSPAGADSLCPNCGYRLKPRE